MSSDEEDYEEESEYEEDEMEVEDDSDKFLTRSDLEAEMQRTMTDAQSVLQVNAGVCRLLLQKFKWNKNSLLDKFYENPDTNEFLTQYNIIPSKLAPTGSQDDVECEICCMESELVGLQCNHLACRECWTNYLSEKVKADQSEIECMTADCKLLIPDEQVKEFICNTNLEYFFDQVTINNYVDANPYLTWCPADDCSKAVKVVNTGTRLITCPCGTIFCFTCGNDGHDPLSCRHLKMWQKKCEAVQSTTTGDGYSSDKETFKWILSNTKDCPKCMTAIEKNGGCNRITCRNKKCMFEFCWLCMRSWAVHGYSPCNSFNEDDEKNRVDSRAELLRLQFFMNRFMEHEKSLQLEKKLVRTVEMKMKRMEELTKSWAETQVLRKAVDVLSECRRTLKFTYAFAFYLERNNHALIFESNQKDLEMAVEQLSGYLERDLESDDLTDLKQKVQDKSRYVEHRRKVLVNHCIEGNELDFWSFKE